MLEVWDPSGLLGDGKSKSQASNCFTIYIYIDIYIYIHIHIHIYTRLSHFCMATVDSIMFHWFNGGAASVSKKWLG